MNPVLILKLLDLIILGVKIAPSVKAAYEEHRAQIQKMIDEEREPTQEEWDGLLKSIQDNTDTLDN